MLGYFFAIFRIFSAFLDVLTHVVFFQKKILIFARFLKVGGGFWEDFEAIFRRFFELSWKNAIL